MSDAVLAVLTYRRNSELATLLPELARQTAGAPMSTRILVIDNDPDGGAREVVAQFDAGRVDYVLEAEPGIAAARNRALDEAEGEKYLIFIDDDELPCENWLNLLLEMAAEENAAAVAGPVESRFDTTPSEWIISGGFFRRGRPANGTHLTVAATNNLLLDMREIRRLGLRFDPDFGLSGGSDTLFTRQLWTSGALMVWCDAALVYDRVPASRATREWVLRRAFRSGNSWARTSVLLAPAGVPRLRVRGELLVEGSLRAVIGYLQYTAGLLRRRQDLQANGLRRARRGAGMVAGLFGRVYVEYARKRVGAR